MLTILHAPRPQLLVFSIWGIHQRDTLLVGRRIRGFLGDLGLCPQLYTRNGAVELCLWVAPGEAQPSDVAHTGRKLAAVLSRRFDVHCASVDPNPSLTHTSCPPELPPVDLGGWLAAAEETAVFLQPRRPQQTQIWSSWRERALAALSLTDIWGPWLTGRTWESWLEATDVFFAPDSGDTVMIADGTGLAERGSVVSVQSDRAMSLFQAMTCVGLADSEADAEQIVARLVHVPLPKVA